MVNRQSGFTLVEIAIVLVIIGLLLGGILKGQALIDSAKSKNLAEDFRNIPIAIYSYQDRFRALAGDDAQYVAHLTSASNISGVALLTPTAANLGNGRIEGLFNSNLATDESVAFWQQLRLAGFLSGSTDFSNPATVLPTNSEGGRIGVQSTPPITGMVGAFFICSNGILGKYAKQLDQTLDDGNTASGSVRVGNVGAVGAAIRTEDIVDSNSYMLCQAN